MPIRSSLSSVLLIIQTQLRELFFYLFLQINFFTKEVRKSEKNQAREEILIFKQEVMMKNKVILLTAMFLIGSFLTAQTSFSTSEYPFEQETYLFKKQEAAGPWKIILPQKDDDTPYAKFEYFNYPVTVTEVNEDEEETTTKGFYFDLKGYNIPTNEGNFLYGPYALIYYPDPWVPGGPEVYVFGVSGENVWESPAQGRARGHDGVNLKIDGVCGYAVNVDGAPLYGAVPDDALVNIPVEDDDNWPNGGKVWLVPADLLASPEACSWTTMGWGPLAGEILFETSLITYGFIAEDE